AEAEHGIVGGVYGRGHGHYSYHRGFYQGPQIYFGRHSSGFRGGYYGGFHGHHGSHYWHDTSHWDYHPGHFVPHYDHYDYMPGHWDWHHEGHWDHH
ncbi:MAG TPA: hypothetical protein VF175_15900, partial [Lacipirellula sp.]